jgi:hypothetical protein
LPFSLFCNCFPSHWISFPTTLLYCKCVFHSCATFLCNSHSHTKHFSHRISSGMKMWVRQRNEWKKEGKMRKNYLTFLVMPHILYNWMWMRRREMFHVSLWTLRRITWENISISISWHFFDCCSSSLLLLSWIEIVCVSKWKIITIIVIKSSKRTKFYLLFSLDIVSVEELAAEK